MKKLLSLLSLLWVVGLVKAQSPCDSLPKVNIQATQTQPCTGDTIILTASGGVTYQWNNNVQNGIGFVPSGSDTFKVSVTDTLGCTGTGTVFIEVLPLPTILANSSSLTTCIGDSIRLTATNGINYTWLNPPAFPNGGFFKPTVLGANIFEVKGDGTNGCFNTSQVIVLVKPTPNAPTVNFSSLATCLNVDFDNEFVASTDTGRPFWFADANLQEIVSDQLEYTPKNDAVGITSYFTVSNLGGCISSATEVTAEVYALPNISIETLDPFQAGEQVEINATVSPTSSEVEWSPMELVNDPFNTSTTMFATEEVTLTLTATDGNNCVSADSVDVNVKFELVISNFITPNGDGDNDTWNMHPINEAQGCQLVIYDGFGRILLETENYQNDWNGTFEGEDLPDGDYYYQLICGENNTKGTITLVR